MYKYGYNFPSIDSMIMVSDNLIGMRFPGGFHVGVLFQVHQRGVSIGIFGLCIPRVGTVITIWDEVLFKHRVYFYGMVSRKRVL